MIKEILNQIAEGNTSLSELFNILGITHSELSSRLKTLEAMGYISTVCQGTPIDAKKCRGCSMAKFCSGSEASAKIELIKVYELTEKGKRACDKSGQEH